MQSLGRARDAAQPGDSFKHHHLRKQAVPEVAAQNLAGMGHGQLLRSSATHPRTDFGSRDLSPTNRRRRRTKRPQVSLAACAAEATGAFTRVDDRPAKKLLP